jgi:uncharacterized protein with ACT and thioredoxin-like domain
VGLGQGGAQAILIAGLQDQVDVVGHQAIAQHLDARRPATRGQFVPIGQLVVVAEENLLSAVAALGHMVRRVADNHSRETGHRTA